MVNRKLLLLISFLLPTIMMAQTAVDGLFVARPDTLPAPMKPQQSSTVPPVMSFDGTPSSFNSQSTSPNQGQLVLLIGDSMCDGLGSRLSDYAAENGFEFHCVIWYGSTAKMWATTGDLRYHIERLRPTFIIMSLGTNDMGYHDYTQRELWIQQIIKQFGDTPYLWIGPLTWRRFSDRTIVEVIRRNVAPNRFFDSTPVYCQRLDGIHPTFPAAARWTDRICAWMTRTRLTDGTITWNLPQRKSVFRPDAKHTLRYKGRR